MEKEQKKLLLVAVSVGVFLLVTITAAVAILTPKANMQETAYTTARPYPSGELLPATVGSSGIQQPALTAQETVNQVESSVPAAAVDIVVPEPTNNMAIPDNKQETLTPVRNAATEAPASKPVVAAKPAASKSTAPAAKPAASKAKTTNDYWIQTGAYSSMVRAEDVKELLSSKGITSIIENREVDGRILYRVRLGPYTSEKEANYWLPLVKSISEFSDSQIRQTVRHQ
jgi:DedD protein